MHNLLSGVLLGAAYLLDDDTMKNAFEYEEELAELQATIAQQAALIHWMKGLLWSGGRPRADEEEYEQMTDYDKGLLHGGIELWDQLDCRLRAKIKEIDLLSSGVAGHE